MDEQVRFVEELVMRRKHEEQRQQDLNLQRKQLEEANQALSQVN
jgi:hypothetical protein